MMAPGRYSGRAMGPDPRIMPLSDEAIAEAARLVLAGEPVAVPTETVYGLAADATNAEAVARIYAAKGRPSFNPLIVHVPDLEAAERSAGSTSRRGRLPEALAGSADPGGAAARRCRIASHRHRRPADDRASSSRPSGDAGAAQGLRPAARRAVGQCQRADQPDARQPCARHRSTAGSRW